MDSTFGSGSQLSQKQKSTLAYSFAEDTDLWLVLLAEFIRTRGEQSESLKTWLIEETNEWKQLISEIKQRGFDELVTLALQNPTEWHHYIQQLLSDSGHTNLLNIYFRSLAAQKIKKVAEVGARANMLKQINVILAAVANEAITDMDKLSEAKVRLESGKTAAGKDLSKTLQLFYEESYKENLAQIVSLIGVIVMLKCAKGAGDIRKLQDYIQTSIIDPLERKTDLLKRRLGTPLIQADYLASEEIKREISGITNKKVFYRKLLRAVDINFA